MTNQSRGELVPGGLALVISARVCQENVGQIVTVVRRVQLGDMHNGYQIAIGEGWLIEGEELLAPTSDGIKKVGFGVCESHRLMPINPEADPMDINDQMECKA